MNRSDGNPPAYAIQIFDQNAPGNVLRTYTCDGDLETAKVMALSRLRAYTVTRVQRLAVRLRHAYDTLEMFRWAVEDGEPPN